VPDSEEIKRKLDELSVRIKKTQESIEKFRQRVEPDAPARKPRKKPGAASKGKK
jgi:hypothetical protein